MSKFGLFVADVHPQRPQHSADHASDLMGSHKLFFIDFFSIGLSYIKLRSV